jgi:6-phosphogluconolactonase
MNEPPLERRFETREALTTALADDIAAQLTTAVASRGAASAVVSGGTTPGPLYERLSRLPAPWAQVTLTLADERWVALDDDLSNERLVRACLERGAAAAVRLVSLKSAHAEPEQAEGVVDAAVRAMPRPFDVVLLGMGEDGHTASLFPHARGLDKALDVADPALARAVRPASPGVAGGVARMSLSLRALLDSRRIVILVFGAAKWAVYQEALQAGAVADMPVRAVLRQDRAPVELWWAP